MRQLFVALVALVALAMPAAASANQEWCTTDPGYPGHTIVVPQTAADHSPVLAAGRN